MKGTFVRSLMWNHTTVGIFRLENESLVYRTEKRILAMIPKGIAKKMEPSMIDREVAMWTDWGRS